MITVITVITMITDYFKNITRQFHKMPYVCLVKDNEK